MTGLIHTLIKEVAGQRKPLYITLLVILIVNIFLPRLYSFLKPLTQNRSALILSGHILLSLIIWLLYSLSFLRENKPKLKLLYGVFWDKNYNIYCPKKFCQNPLIAAPDSKNTKESWYDWYCPNCEQKRYIRNKGEIIEREKAIELIKQSKNT